MTARGAGTLNTGYRGKGVEEARFKSKDEKNK